MRIRKRPFPLPTYFPPSSSLSSHDITYHPETSPLQPRPVAVPAPAATPAAKLPAAPKDLICGLSDAHWLELVKLSTLSRSPQSDKSNETKLQKQKQHRPLSMCKEEVSTHCQSLEMRQTENPRRNQGKTAVRTRTWRSKNEKKLIRETIERVEFGSGAISKATVTMKKKKKKKKKKKSLRDIVETDHNSRMQLSHNDADADINEHPEKSDSDVIVEAASSDSGSLLRLPRCVLNSDPTEWRSDHLSARLYHKL